MTFVNALIARISQDEEGQGLAEYALILALIAIVAIVALIFLGGQISRILHRSAPRSNHRGHATSRPPASAGGFWCPPDRSLGGSNGIYANCRS